MPQKSNPIGSELVIALSALAGQYAGALLLALQGTHERAAGEWQIEWDALPLVFAAAAGSVAEARRIVDGLRVVPERMRQNLDAEGGTIMAESVMMALAGVVGRSAAHDLVYEASTLARGQRITLEHALRKTIDQDLLNSLGPLERLLDPHCYLGEADRIVTVALDRWKSVTSAPGEEAGRARR
jgi:3-carboxy-cis,cis-muconate cycloisomerase